MFDIENVKCVIRSLITRKVLLSIKKDHSSRVGIKKKYCFVKKLDNNVPYCTRSASTIAM